MYQKDLFKNKSILVTGGRSGIGYGIAKMFLELGAKVFIASRKTEPLQKAAEELSAIGPCGYLATDIRKTEQVKALADAIGEKYGRLDILINNAGGQFPAPAEAISENGWVAVINNNLNGTFFMSQQMAKSFFIPQKEGNIINITANVFRGFPGMSHTGAARAGVENLTKSLAREWAEFNIRVNAVAPGTIISSGLDQYPPMMIDFLKQGAEESLMGRYGSVEDVANAVMFFASPLSAYINGFTLYVDGLERLDSDRMKLYNLIKGFYR
ncbi:MAG: SDR family oxidoreductase [Bacteroidota bacterium]